MTDAPLPDVYFILGGPGSGKGTNCARLVADYGFVHLSAGDLLRDAAKKGDTPVAKQIGEIIRSGNIVPSEITVALLKESLAAAVASAAAAGTTIRGFLIDGFPRKADQATMFEEGIARAKGILYFDCSEATMEARVLGRAAESGTGGAPARDDDNAEAMRRRFRVNVEQCMPVVESYRQAGRCEVIDANKERDEVYAQVKRVMAGYGAIPQ